MLTKSKFTVEDQWRLNDALVEFIQDQPIEEFAADMQEAGLDFDHIAAEMDALVLKTVKRFKNEALRNSRRRYEAYLSEFRAMKLVAPKSLKEKKEQVFTHLSLSQGLGLAPAATQFKELSELSENDLEAYYRSCQYLKSITAS